ncbi:methyl-accepting chemotaxis protein PctC [mine drainage metagenome]|uniref:Methyl-accepting chemotaxis protein PctC n=1 Tax=mine drainage metagenome TaxID=410659 RepID=A0A1J5S8N7_9ZZZZ
MKHLFVPAYKLCDGLSFATKFRAVGVLLLLPLGSMAYLLFDAGLAPGVHYLLLGALLTGLLGLYLLGGMFFSITGTISSFVAAIDRFSQGDLAAQVHSSAKDELGHVAVQFNAMRQDVKRMIARISGGAAMVAEAAAKLSDKSRQVTALAQQQTDAASSVAAAVEEMTTSIAMVAGHAGDTETVSAKASELSAEGERVVRDASSEMSRIAESFNTSSREIASLGQRTGEISSIVNVIKEIADQTNLLALNAAIEAARAGEQGRGFAVVADEVRKLAERTSSATQEITTMIDNIQTSMKGAAASMGAGVSQVTQGVALASRAGDALADINKGAKDVLAMVHDIASAVQEQTTASHQIAENIERISIMAQDSNASMEQMSAEAGHLGTVSGGLKEAISLFSGGTANDAQQLVEKGVALIAAQGRQKAFAAFADPDGEFIKRDLYLFVYDTNGKVLAHGGNPALVGKSMLDAKDANGKLFIRERIEIATSQGSGWQDYMFNNPESKLVESKTSFIRKLDDMIVGCGVYK